MAMRLVALAILIFGGVGAAKEMENPGRNIPIAFAVSTGITGIPYAILAYVWAAVMPRIFLC